MQESGPSFPDLSGSEEPPKIRKLRAELARLKEKRDETNDREIITVLNMRIAEIEPQLPPLPGEEPVGEEDPETIQLRAELARLQKKLAQNSDKDIVAVLKIRIDQIEPQIAEAVQKAREKAAAAPKAVAAVAQPAAESPAPLAPVSGPPAAAPNVAAAEPAPIPQIPLPSREQADKAEQLIRQSRLEKQRGNKTAVTDLLKKAVEAAPGSPTVLEALGDDYMERRLIKQACEVYKRAVDLDKKNVGLDRKWAQAEFARSSANVSIDAMLLSTSDNVAGIWAARFFSFFVPGVGQMVIGRTTKGIVLFSISVLSFLWIAIGHNDFEALMRSLFGKGAAPNYIIVVPVIGLAVAWIAAMADLSGGGSTKQAARHTKVERPTPPVDLPFD